MKTKKNLKESVKNLILLKSMFSRLVASFVLVIIIISSFHLVTNLIYSHNMEQEITNKIETRFEYVSNQYESYFNEIKEKVLKEFYLKYWDDFKTPERFSYDTILVIKDMTKYAELHKYIRDFIVVKKEYKWVLTLNGSFLKDYFFNQHYISDYYNEDFWMKECTKGYMFKFYPVKKYTASTATDNFEKKEYDSLLPMVQFVRNSNCVFITLIDAKQLSNSMDPDFRNNFYIFTEDKELLYSTEGGKNTKIVDNIINKKNIPSYCKLENGYVFTYKSPENSLIYCKYYPNSLVRKQMGDMNRILTLIILLSMFISVVLSVFIVKKFNNPVKQIYQLIKQSRDISGAGSGIIDLKNIKEDIAGVITNYERDIDEKNSLLKSYFYQVKLKNIILSDEQADKTISESGNYAVILFKTHFRDAFYEKIASEKTKGSYILKDMIHVYVRELCSLAVTFQIEHDQIVTILNINKDDADLLEEDINKIVDKLKSEDEYVYFTVAYSKIYHDSSELHEAYKKVTQLIRYRKLAMRTQILSESSVCKKPDRLHFTEDQQKQFSNLLCSGKRDECIRLIDKTFDYNVKNEINEFSIYLLFVQVIDCCSNVLMQLYNEIPADLTLVNDYLSLGQCDSVDDYRKRYTNIINECSDYIEKNQKQTDYIVDYVKNYINENYDKDITVEMLADKLNISHTYLSRYFKNTTGINLSDYLNIFRMKKACMLLQNSFIPVKDIAPKVGIYNISTFLRSFKSYTGKSPNDYRKSLLN